MSERRITASLLATLFLAIPASAAESVAELLEKAIYTENTVGNLEEAISIYEKIIAVGEANRVTVAQAHLRRGLCLAKKGDKAGAREAFLTVKAKFSEQREVVTAANRELTKLGPVEGAMIAAVPAQAPRPAVAMAAAPAAGPVVLRTNPAAFNNAVPPTLKELSVTFNTRMADGSWSWTGGGDTFPKITGNPSYDSAGTTCSVPVELEPGKVYWVGINSPSHRNFKSTAGKPAQRYVILFATADAEGKPTTIPDEMVERAKAVNAASQQRQPVKAAAASGPTVVGTSPTALDNKVPASTREITATFSEKMADGNWSWTGGGDTFPKTGQASYDEAGTTCKLPVELEPGKVYWVGVNSPSHKNFKSAAGQPAQRYVILFATADADGKPTPIPDELLQQAKAINAASQPGGGEDAGSAMTLLDEDTRQAIEQFEQAFGSWFAGESTYEAGSPAERAVMVEQWMTEAKGQDFAKRTRAIAALGNVRARQAVHTLLEIAEEPMSNNRPKWMAVRGLGRIKDPVAAPTLIDLVDHGNLNVRVYARLALAQITGKYFGEDKAAWRQAIKQRGANVSPAEKREAETLHQQGWRMIQGGKLEEAEGLMKQATAKDPMNANAWNGLGWAQMNQGKPLAAKLAFERAVELDPKAAAAWNGLGYVAKNEGDKDAAIEHWKKAVEANPRGTAALGGLASTYMELEKPQEAVKYFEMWLKADPQSAEAKAGLQLARGAAPGQ